MSAQWALLNEAQSSNNLDYNVYRCVDPVAVKTGDPWYPISNICPCDPQLSGSTGRGFMSCPMGLSVEKPGKPLPISQILNQIPPQQQVTGSLFNQNQFVPPQLDPRQLTMIGYQWRSAN